MTRLRLRVGLGCALFLSAASLLSGSGQVPVPRPVPGGRMQLNEWTDASLGVSDPLHQIVRITREGSTVSGTGFLLANCRIMTAAHVIVPEGSTGGSWAGAPATVTETDLIGERFNYETQPLPALDGRRARGQFVILGHGVTGGKTQRENFIYEDWAIGYDENCMAEKYQLGHLDIFWTVFRNQGALGPNPTGVAKSAAAKTIEGRRLFTAGYSWVQIPGVSPDSWPLLIDSECEMVSPPGNPRGDREEFARYRSLATNCSLHAGGSGQPLLSPVIENGRVVRDERGRPRLEALGLFQLHAGSVNNEPTLYLMAFNADASRRLRPFLTAKITGRLADLLHDEARRRDVDRSIGIAIDRRIRSRDWPVAAGSVEDTVCVSGKAAAAIESCTTALQAPNVSRPNVFTLLRRRAQLRYEGGDTGPALRDLNLAQAVITAAPRTGVDDAVIADLHNARGAIYHQAELFADSRQEYGKALEFALKDWPSVPPDQRAATVALLKARADIHNHLRVWRAEAEDYGRVIALAPDDADARNGRCFAYASLDVPAPGERETGLSDCNRALELKPDTPAYLDSRALTYLKMGRLPDAIRDYDAVIVRSPETAESLFGRGVAKVKAGIESGEADILAARAVQDDIDSAMIWRGVGRPTTPEASVPRGNVVPKSGPPEAFPSRQAVLEKQIFRWLNGVHTLLNDDSVRSATDTTTVAFLEYTASEIRLQIRRTPLTASGGGTAGETTTVTVNPGLLSEKLVTRTRAGFIRADLILACEEATPVPGAECIAIDDAGGRRRAVTLSLPLPAKNAGPIAILLKRAIEAAREAR